MNAAEEKDRLLRSDPEWAKAASERRDIERIRTEGAVVMPPRVPSIAGKLALRQYVTDSMRIPGFSITWTSDEVTFSPGGQLAYMFSRDAGTVNGRTGRR